MNVRVTPREHAAPSPATVAPPEDLGSAPPAERVTPLVPYSLEIVWCAAVEDQAHAVSFYEAISDAIEHAGGFPQGGAIETMTVDDVVPDSPLAVALDTGAEGLLALERTE